MEPPFGNAQNDIGRISDVTAKLAETSLLLEVLGSVNSIMSKAQTFESFCANIANLLKEKFGFYIIQIWVIDERQKSQMHLVPPDPRNPHKLMTLSEGIIGKAIREHRTVCVPNVAIDSDYLNVDSTTKSELCIPLIYENEVIGAINIETNTYQNFSAQLSVLEVIASNLSHCLKLSLLYRTKEQFQYLVENMSEGVWVGDMSEKTLYTNPALQKMLGYEEQELLHKTSFDFFDEQSQQTLREENVKRQIGISSNYEAILVTKNGTKIPALLHGVPFGNGKGTIATITDLRTMKKLAETEKFLSSITQHCAEAIVGLDLNENTQSWNVGAERMFGYEAQEMLGKSIFTIIPEDRIASGESQRILEDVKNKKVIRNFETMRLHKNGNPINVSITCSGIKDEKHKLIGYSVFYKDITAQKKWERELQDRFEKMQDAYKEMGRQRRYLDYLTDMINMTASNTYTTKQIATFLVNAMVMITKVDAATLRILDRSSNKLILVAQSGLGEEWWGKKSISYSGSLLEAAVAQKHSLKILDILSNPRYASPALAQKNNLRSALVIPLEAKNEIVGSLTLYLSHEGNLSLLDDEFIAVFTKQATLALQLAN